MESDDYCPYNDRKNPEIISNKYKLVGDLIRDIKNNKHKLPIGLVSVIYLYYDGWNSITDSKWKLLRIMISLNNKLKCYLLIKIY